jgi:prefoldin subunit 5
MSKNIDEQVDKLEAAVDPNTVISIGGYSFTPAKLMVAGAIISSVLGGLYGAFEVYKDYQSMKEAIQTYVAPDLSELNKKIAIVEENSAKAVDYTRDIKNDLKNDIRRLEGVVEQVERSAKQSAREANDAQKEQERELRQVRKEVDDKIKKALDNPLAN